MYKNLVFDGTIANSRDIVNEMLSELALKHNLGQITPKEIKHRSELSLMKKNKFLLFIRKVDAEFKDLYCDNVQRILPVNGMIDTLKQLNQMGIGISIISSNRKGNIELFLQTNGISFLTNIISVKGLFGKHKAIKRFKTESADIGPMLYIGDEIRDIEACEKANADIVFVTWGLNGNEDIRNLKTRYIIKEPQDLIGFVKEHL